MSVIQDILNLVRKGPELAGQINDIKLNKKSITRGAKDATFQFPCLVVDTLPIDMANTIARTLDHVYATFTQTWLSANQTFDITIDPSPLTYLKKYHQNINFEAFKDFMIDEDDYDKYMEKVYDGSYKLFLNKEGTYGVLFNVADKPTMQMMESHRDLLRSYLSDYDLHPLEVVKEDFSDDSMSATDFANKLIDNQIAEDNRKNKIATTGKRDNAPRLLDRDVKRSNDLVPYAIEVRLAAVNDKKQLVEYIDIVLGIKTILHPVPFDDMVTNIGSAMQNKSFMFKFLRWTSGELSLTKDLILNLNEIKDNAVNVNNPSKTPFFATLKKLKKRRLGVRNLTVPHALLPTSTIVITSYEVDFINDHYGVNLRDARMGAKLLNALFLVGFIIVDEGTNTMSVIYDGDTSYQTYSLDVLERDNLMNSNKLSKEIGRMISH